MARSAGYDVVGILEQTRPPDARYQIGAGKVEELAKMVADSHAEKVIFDNPLRTLQNYNLAKATKVEVMDRFQLILELFRHRATTTEAQYQILSAVKLPKYRSVTIFPFFNMINAFVFFSCR